MAAALLLVFAAGVQSDELAPPKLEFSRVAVLVYAQSPETKKLIGSAQTRLEQILLDNGVEVTDRDDSSKIKGIWKKLEDPGYFITADDFVKNTQKYGLDGVARIYLNADVTEVMSGFFSATAQADVRLVDEDAKVNAKTSYPMGAPGRPPSDGLTAQAALLNAIQRAVDDAAQTLGLTIAEPASPRAVMFRLEGPTDAPATAQAQPRKPRDLEADYVGLAQLASGRNTSEAVTCADQAPGGAVAAVGGALQVLTSGSRGQNAPRVIINTDRSRNSTGFGPGSGAGPGERHYGSRIHLLDLAEQREITIFETREVGRKPKEHRGSFEILDCAFIHSWRYLASVTGDVLSLWDTERGLKLAEILLPFGTDEATLEVQRSSDGLYLRVQGEGKRQATYRVVPGASKTPG